MTPVEIKAFRRRLGLSQRLLAESLPVPRRTLEDWERALRHPPEYLKRALRDLEREMTEPPSV